MNKVKKIEKRKQRIKRWGYGVQEARKERKEDGKKMDEGGEVEDLVVKGEEGKTRKGFFLSCTKPEEEV